MFKHVTYLALHAFLFMSKNLNYQSIHEFHSLINEKGALDEKMNRDYDLDKENGLIILFKIFRELQ